ncbi:flavin reductase [Micromonospora chersina]|uniref:flavin reductase n=1 Tax=Micromonospora chersina TaxID=47854 RepID=UPI0033D4FB78
MTTHVPVKPAWTCGGCGANWPCETRRRELRAEYDGALVSLALYLATQLVDATQDLTHVPAGHLHRRFLGWTR